jgi:hypothetical protein
MQANKYHTSHLQSSTASSQLLFFYANMRRKKTPTTIENPNQTACLVVQFHADAGDYTNGSSTPTRKC